MYPIQSSASLHLLALRRSAFTKVARPALIEFVIAALNPILPFNAIGEEEFSYAADVFLGMKPVENLNRLGE